MTQLEAPVPMTPRKSHAPAMLLTVLVVVLLCLVPGVRAQQETAVTDLAALQALYDTTDGANWEDSTNWSTAVPLSVWYGVTTDRNGRVTELDLRDNGLNGTLPAALGNLTELERLDLRNNSLEGPLPTELENLGRLESLQLDGNYALAGHLPTGIHESSRLGTLGIKDTELCVPDDGALQTWLEEVSFAGFICPPAEQSVIDVAVFYTPAIREALGGFDLVEAAIDLMVAETNVAYEASGVNQRIKVVAAEEVIGYTEATPKTDLFRLKSQSDGHMDEVHGIRDKVGADIVVLLSKGGRGMAFRSLYVPKDRWAFAVVHGRPIEFAHELGHIMGLSHDRYTRCHGRRCDVFNPIPYAFGYVNQRAFDPHDPESPNPDATVPTTARWRTIMAYTDQCDAAGVSCKGLLRFSNPDQIHPDPDGDPLGKAGLEHSPGVDGPSDAVRLLNRTRGYVANLRSPPDITVSITTGPGPVSEGTPATFTVTRTGPEADALTIAVSVTESGAMLAANPPVSMTFGAGESFATLTAATQDDAIVEGASTVTAAIANGEGYSTAPDEGSAQVSVEDNDVAAFAVSFNPEEIAEGQVATLVVAISNGVTFAEAQAISLVTSGTASAADYTGVSATLAMVAGASSVTAELAASADQEEEEAETVTVTASHGGTWIGSATVTIRSVSHDATLSALSLSGIDIGAFSGDTTAYVASVAHEISSTTVTAAASQARASVSISPGTEVSLAVGANKIAVTVTAEDGSTTKTYTVMVTRTGMPEASIAEGASPVTEGTAASFTLTLDQAAPEALTVSVSVAESGSALSGTPPAAVAFAKGETSARLAVPTAGDSVVEVDSTVTVTVAAGTDYTVGTASSASVTVEDDDAATFTVSADAESISEGETATLTVAISNGVTFAEAQTISLATSGTASAADYTGVPAMQTLEAGASSVTATLTALVDQEQEAEETVTITASHGGSTIGSATLTIHSVSHDATLGSLSLSGIEIGAFSGAVRSYQASVGHSVATTTVTATATHSGATVSIAPASEVSLAVGANEIAVTVTAEDGSTTRTYTVTVTRAEAPALPLVSVAAVEERVTGPIGAFTVSRTGPTAEPLEVQVLFATSHSPRAQTLTVRFLPGQSRVTRKVQAGNNRLVEDDITVTWTLQEGEGYTVSAEQASASLVVEESDVPEFSVSAEPAGIAEGESATVTVAITNGVRFREAQTIALAVSGTATATDYTGVPETLTLRAYGTLARFSTTATLTAAVDQEQEEAETVTVTASHGGSAIGSATVTITSVSHDATLGALSLSGIEIGAFSGAVTSYLASVEHAVATTTVTATATHSAATVSIQPGSEVSLAVGANEIAVTVTAEDGTTTQSYTVTVTRAEEPALPVVSVAAVEERVAGPIGEFTVSRTGPTAEPLEVQVLFATSRSPRAQTLTVRFLPGQSRVTRKVQAGDNRLVEDDITVTWRVQEGEGYAVSAEQASASLVVEESDVPEFSVSAEPAGIAEGESATVTVAITNGVRFREAQTIALAVSGTATATDYTGVPETLTLRAYGTSATFSTTATLTATVDQEQEEAETVTVTASHGGSAIGSATVTITSVSHDATLGALSLSGIEIGAFSGAVTSYRASVDHAVEATTVTATATHYAATVSIALASEVSLAVGANEIAVTVTAEDGSTTRTYTVTVTRAEAPALPLVSVAAVEERVTGPIGAFTVSRTGPTAEPLEVQVLFATSRTQRVRTLTVRFPPGRSRVTRRVQAGDNKLVEDDITVTGTLEEGEGYTVSAEHASAALVLEESDVPEFSVSAEPAGIAEGESATVTVAITNGVRFPEAQTIALAVSGTATATDYTGVPETLALPAYRTKATTATLTATVDPEQEADETVTITASHGGAEIGSAMVTIGAGEAPPLTAQFVGMPVTHDGETAFRFELRFSEEIKISYVTLRDTAFQVTGGAVRRARRLVRPSNQRWEITVEPSSDTDVVLALPATVDCAAAGAVCTAGGKALSGRLEATVKGPDSEASGEGFSLDPENSSPSGIWSDGETAWVADLADAKLYAYQREDGERQPEKDIATEPSPMGLWSDGGTLWVTRQGGGLRAYLLANGARLADRDLALEATAAPSGVWSDGETAWVSEWLGDTVHAYRLEDGRRVAGRDIKLAGGNLLPMGLWSDGETLWVADWRERMYAYRLSDGERMPELDLAAGSKDEDPSGLWSGGGTLLSTSWESDDVRAYAMPEAAPRSMDANRLKGLGGQAGSLPPIADPALLAAIKAALGKASGESVSAAELAGLETLEARNGGIRSLAGLEGATSLNELDLGFNPVADLWLLASLPALESLNLDGTAPDLQLLVSLTGLKRLSLRNNGIDDLQPLAPLAGLTELDVGDNLIGDLSPLTGLTGLAVLRADRNRIADLWPLASLAGLEALELGANRILDLHPVAGLTQLRSLRLEGNGLTELSPLAGLEGLRDLGLAGNAVASVGALADLGGLRRLDLRGTAVEDLRPLSALPSLVWVHVGGSRIKDLLPLDNVSGLTVAGREDRDSPTVAVKDDARASRQ